MQARAKGRRVDAAEFLNLDLRVHDFLYDVALHDVSAIELPGGPAGATLGDVMALRLETSLTSANLFTRVLFRLRFLLGRIFRWDAHEESRAELSYVRRLSDEDARRSTVPPGTRDGPFRIVYAFAHEAVREIVNATVHAFLASALIPIAGGYRLYWAVYVKPASRWTPLYMRVIEPFRRFIVYPSLLGRLRRAWIARYEAQDGAT